MPFTGDSLEALRRAVQMVPFNHAQGREDHARVTRNDLGERIGISCGLPALPKRYILGTHVRFLTRILCRSRLILLLGRHGYENAQKNLF